MAHRPLNRAPRKVIDEFVDMLSAAGMTFEDVARLRRMEPLEAAKLLNQLREALPPEIRRVTTSRLRAVAPVTELKLPTAVQNVLMREKISTVYHLFEIAKQHPLESPIRNIGFKYWMEILDALEDAGYNVPGRATRWMERQ